MATVLAADDDEGSRDIGTTALADVGYTARQACFGDEALGPEGRERPVLILLDRRMLPFATGACG